MTNTLEWALESPENMKQWLDYTTYGEITESIKLAIDAAAAKTQPDRVQIAAQLLDALINSDIKMAAEEAAQAGYDLAQSESKWVSVNDRLPGKADDYLVFGHSSEHGELVTMSEYNNRIGFKCFLQVTHWLPLPPLPTPPDDTDKAIHQ